MQERVVVMANQHPASPTCPPRPTTARFLLLGACMWAASGTRGARPAPGTSERLTTLGAAPRSDTGDPGVPKARAVPTALPRDLKPDVLAARNEKSERRKVAGGTTVTLPSAFSLRTRRSGEGGGREGDAMRENSHNDRAVLLGRSPSTRPLELPTPRWPPHRVLVRPSLASSAR